ncbi:MBOAT family O-acyltransferase, partial [Klebsiella pneumoniae]|uniref:MBOAT family O-acyltransferase n=1 Tax=Klebsiella pneumoniae TaxID=573 RepID=UPI00385550CC
VSGYANVIFDNPGQYHNLQVLIGVLAFTVQIYCDFSGYTDIALGAARCMGFTLMTNFNRPYFATNIRDFWARWHISLSTWFRDYVY